MRKQNLIKNKDLKEIFPLIRYMASLPATNPYHINISNVELLNLWNEIRSNGRLLSGSKISPNYAEKLGSKASYKLHQRISSFKRFIAAKFNINKIYGYQMVINPQILDYDTAVELNKKIVHNIRKGFKNALIEAALEHTYNSSGINVHLQYTIVSTARINKRDLYRSCKSIAKKFTGGDVNKQYSKYHHGKPFEKITNWRAAESYETKDCGWLPMPLLHHQHERFKKMKVITQMALIARDLLHGKGKTRHHFYINPKNKFAKAWKKYVDAKKKNKSYCIRHNVLVNPAENAKDDHINKHSTVLNVDYFKLNPHARVRHSKHHGTTIETERLYKYGNRYHKDQSQVPNIQQLSLFNRLAVNV